MVIERVVLTRDQVTFEVRFAVGSVPRSVWVRVRVRGRDRLASDGAIEQVMQAVVEWLSKHEIVRFSDSDTVDFRNLLRGRDK